MTFNGDFGEAWGDDEPRLCKLVPESDPNLSLTFPFTLTLNLTLNLPLTLTLSTL